VCHRRAVRDAAKRLCPQCQHLRHLQPPGICATCVRVAAPRRPRKTMACQQCGEQRRNAGHGLCNRCILADPDRPFRYAAAAAGQLATVPTWWDELTAFAAARHHPGGAVTILRETVRLLTAEPTSSPQQLLSRCTPADRSTALAARALTAFFTSHGLALPDDAEQRRAAARRQRYLDLIPAPLHSAVGAFDRAQIEERDQNRRTGRHQLSDITLETRLRILRDLATHLMARRHLTGWAEVTAVDLEDFLARRPNNRHQHTYLLRRFFGWARRNKLTLTNPAQPLRLGAQPGFTGAVLDLAQQRSLFSRWTGNQAHPHERLIGLLALLHGASNRQIRTLTVSDIDPARRAVQLSGRPFPSPLDPTTWAALTTCMSHRDQLGTLNQHVIVTGATRTRDTPADGSYLTRALAPSGTTPSACRHSRIAQLVTDLDPKLAAAALGMQDSGLVRYLADNVDQDRIQRTTG
jgi:hypothetical protein